jgi:hypothetical protein
MHLIVKIGNRCPENAFDCQNWESLPCPDSVWTTFSDPDYFRHEMRAEI